MQRNGRLIEEDSEATEEDNEGSFWTPLSLGRRNAQHVRRTFSLSTETYLEIGTAAWLAMSVDREA
jgi:hypothetical protein